MRRPLGLAIVALMCVVATAHARPLLSINHQIKGDHGQGALRWAQNNAERFGHHGADLRITRTITFKDGSSVTKLEQWASGLPVLDAQLSIFVSRGRIVTAAGRLASVASPTKPEALFSRPAAERALKRLARFSDAAIRSAKLAIWKQGAQARTVWALELRTANPFGLWHARLDAKSGKLLFSRSTLSHAAPVQANVYATNPTVSKVKKVALLGLSKPGTLSGEFADSQSCGIDANNKLICKRYAVADKDGNYLFQPKDPSMEDPFAEVQAYYHVDSFHRWLKKTFGFARKGTKQQIRVVVNFYAPNRQGNTQGVYNAFFGDVDNDGVGDLVFGQGQRDFAYDADVIYHEFTHSVVNETANLSTNLDELGLNEMPAALNEAFADIFSTIFVGDPKLGEYAGNGSIRNLAGNAKCPDNLAGESHNDGLIWGQANWSIRTQVSDTAAYDQLIYKTLAAMGRHPTIKEAGDLLLKIAQTDYPPIAPIVKAELTKRGITECSRIIPMLEGKKLFSRLRGTDEFGGLNLVPSALQFRIDVPKEALSLKITTEWLLTKWAPSSLGLYIKKGEPVKMINLKAVGDFLMPNNESSITLKVGDKDRPLEPGKSYYLLPVNVAKHAAPFRMIANFTRAEPPKPDAAPVLADAGVVQPDASSKIDAAVTKPAPKSGCAVSASEGASGLSLTMLLLAALCFLRRRRS